MCVSVGGCFRQRSYGRGYKYSCRVLGLCTAAGLQQAVSCLSVSTLAVVGLVGCNCQSVVCGFSSPAAKPSTEVRGGGSSPSKKTTPILAFKLIFSSCLLLGTERISCLDGGGGMMCHNRICSCTTTTPSTTTTTTTTNLPWYCLCYLQSCPVSRSSSPVQGFFFPQPPQLKQ